MFKSDEQSHPQSCLNKALPHEMLFVMLARDRAAPDAIRAWCAKRVSLGLNHVNDPQIVEALRSATHMESQFPYIREDLQRGI